MSTRSDIIAKLSDGQWKRIYCHSDGYLSHNGRILFENYRTQTMVDALLKPGDLSSLDIYHTKPKGHSFDKRVPGHCVYYGRDRGEKNTGGAICPDFDLVWPHEDDQNEFSYVWDGEQWFVGELGNSYLTVLADALQGDELEGKPRIISPRNLGRGDAPVTDLPKDRPTTEANPAWGAF